MMMIHMYLSKRLNNPLPHYTDKNKLFWKHLQEKIIQLLFVRSIMREDGSYKYNVSEYISKMNELAITIANNSHISNN